MTTDNSYIERLLNILKATGKKYNLEKITAAYEYAASLHEGQFRVSGDPYISHPIAVAEIVAGLELDTDSICAALLHDTVEDCADKTNIDVIKKLFGESVALLVDGLTKIVQLKVDDKEEAHIENLRKMLLAMSKDIRVIFIKLCDRLHNMRTLAVKPDMKRRSTALETMQVYAPLAHRLGMQKIKQELENISISFLDPIGYENVKSHIEQKYGMNVDFIENVRSLVDAKVRENDIRFSLEGRIKSVYSLYRKMYDQGKNFDEIYDFYALRVIVDTEQECYAVLGLIHEMFKSVPGRFKDYISTPKPNMYRSLHTTVIGRDGIPFEVQIRTWEMHHIAEYGVAAHWKYKSGEQSNDEIDKKLEWISKLIEYENENRDPEEFMRLFKIDIFQDETFVFTPKGDVIALPQGSTVIDFAYAIHSAVGNKMVGAKINNMIVPIDRVPQNGEIVEILTSSSCKGPSRDWLKIVKTGEARTKIRAWFKKEKRVENIEVGKELIDAEIKKFAKSCTEAQRDEIVSNICARTGFTSADDLYNALGYGGLALSKVAIKIHDEYDRLYKEEEEAPSLEPEIPINSTKKIATGGIIVDGESGCQVKFARCCNPLPGDDVIGFITKGHGISIHKRDCPNAMDAMSKPENAERWVNASWERQTLNPKAGAIYEALIQVYAFDSITLIADLSAALADMKVAILAMNMQKRSDNKTTISLKIGCKNIDHVNSIVSRIRHIKDVDRVERGFS